MEILFRKVFIVYTIDPLDQPTVTAGSDHYYHTCSPYVHTSVRPHFSKCLKTNQISIVKISIAPDWPRESLMTHVLC